MRDVSVSSAFAARRLGLAGAALALAACSGSEPAAAPPPPPAVPGPVLFLGAQFTATQRAARAVVDAGTIWLLDESGDLVFGADPAAHWNAQSGLSLAWEQVPGAVKYRVMARNTAGGSTAWQELVAVDAPDATLVPTVVASGVNPWSKGLGTGGSPWGFGNHVQFVVASEDGAGAVSTGGLSDLLDTADAFPGLLTGLEIDRAGLPVPFDPQLERGSTFTKTIRLAFSEPMRTGSPPVLTPESANLTVRRVRAGAWGTDVATPSASPPSAAAHAFLSLELSVLGACAEILVGRSAGDHILVVRDPALFAAGAEARLAFLEGTSGALLGGAQGVASTSPALGRVALATPLEVDLPAGALACALTGGATPPPRLVAEAGTRLEVSDVTPFFVGEQVAVHEPGGAGATPVHDLRTVAGLDTVDRVLVLSAPLSAGHGPGSVILPLNGLGGEVALRGSAALALQRDAVGGPDTPLFLAAPANVMVGDTVLVDADGQLSTTPDQAQARVKQVRFAPEGTAAHAIVLDLPEPLILIHGQAAIVGMGDSFAVSGTRDTTAEAAVPLDPHADQFSPDGRRY